MNKLPAELYELREIFKAATRPLSARNLANKLNTYPATIKRRVEALRREGVKFRKTTVQEGRRGFPSEAWVLDAKA